MTRVDEETLSLHLEVALSGAAPPLLDDLVSSDWCRRYAACGKLAEHLAERLRCFDIWSEQGSNGLSGQPMLFPDDIGPISIGAG